MDVLTGLSWEDLLWRCIHQASRDAWDEFVRRFHPVIAGNVARIVRNRCVDPAAIEEIVQEVYLKLCERDFKILRDFHDDREDGLYAFLKVVSANAARDRCDAILAARRGGGKVVSLSGQEESVPASSDFSVRVLDRLLLNEVEAILPRFTAGPSAARDESIFWLHHRQGLTAREISSIPLFGLTIKGVESVLQRLITQVRTGMIPATGEIGAEGPGTSKPLI
jgi:DNA-directed RNA polymerase specialized sigma24 family protein